MLLLHISFKANCVLSAKIVTCNSASITHDICLVSLASLLKVSWTENTDFLFTTHKPLDICLQCIWIKRISFHISYKSKCHIDCILSKIFFKINIAWITMIQITTYRSIFSKKKRSQHINCITKGKKTSALVIICQRVCVCVCMSTGLTAQTTTIQLKMSSFE